MTYPVRRHTKSRVLVFAVLLATSCLTPVMAQAQSTEAPPKQYTLDGNGVDLGTGKLGQFAQEGGIGTLSRTVVRKGLSHNSWDQWLCQQTAGDSINVSMGMTSKSFGGMVPPDNGYDQLVLGTSTHNLYQESGDITAYDAALPQPGCAISGMATLITKPSGEKIRLYYKTATVSGGTNRRLQSVTSSFGYQLKFNYLSNTVSSADWNTISSVISLNNSAEYCDPTADTCTLAIAWPTVSYTYSSGTVVVADALNRQTTYTASGVTTPQGVVTTYGGSFASGIALGTSTITKAGGTWTYVRTGQSVNTGDYPPPVKYTETITDPLGNVTFVKTPPGEKVVDTYTDALGKVTNVDYDERGNISQITYPEGNIEQWSYMAGTTVSVTKRSKPADGAVAIGAGQGNFSDVCAGPAICMRPGVSSDFNGKQTDYTYDPVHGGVLTVTAPADSNGIRPKTTNTYTLMYPQVKNAAGALVNGDPIYMLTKSSTCRTTASCATTADETVTTYTYNNNLLKASETVASGDGSLSVTTSYGYDNYGRVVWGDGPRTDVDDKSYVTYDLAGQKIFEIGPDPDGGGALLRQIVKHVYNLDGQETETRMGTGIATDGSNFVTSSFKRMTYNSYGQLVKTEAVVP